MSTTLQYGRCIDGTPQGGIQYSFFQAFSALRFLMFLFIPGDAALSNVYHVTKRVAEAKQHE